MGFFGLGGDILPNPFTKFKSIVTSALKEAEQDEEEEEEPFRLKLSMTENVSKKLRNPAKFLKGKKTSSKIMAAGTKMVQGAQEAVDEMQLAIWETAGDREVCEFCNSMEGVIEQDKTPGKIAEVHPDDSHEACRCSWEAV